MIPANGVLHRFVWFAAERGLRLAITFVVGAAVARYLGPETYGMIAYSASTVAVFSVFFGLGIDALVTRDLSRDRRSDASIVGTALVVRMLTGFVAFAFCFVFARVADLGVSGLKQLLLWQSLILLFGWSDVLDGWFQSGPQLWIGICIRVVVSMAAAGLRVYLVFTDAAPYAFVLAGVVESAVIASALWFGFKTTRLERRALSFDAALAVDFLKRGWPLAISAGLVTFVLQGDRIVLGHLSSAEQVGLYAVSARFLDVLLILPVLLGMSVQRLFAQEAAAHMEARSGAVRRILILGNWIGLGAAVIMCAGAGWFVPTAFGTSFSNAAPILNVHAWIVIFVMQVSLRTRVLVAEGRQRLVLILSIVTAATQIALLPLAIRMGGGVGAAYATLAAWICGAWIGPLFFRHSRWFVVAFFRGMVFPFRH